MKYIGVSRRKYSYFSFLIFRGTFLYFVLKNEIGKMIRKDRFKVGGYRAYKELIGNSTNR